VPAPPGDEGRRLSRKRAGTGTRPYNQTGPCRGKASDGGDLGCRFTPEMLEMLKKALELRRKGIIKF